MIDPAELERVQLVILALLVLWAIGCFWVDRYR